MSAGRHPQNPQIRYLTHGHDCTPFGGLSLGFKISKWATLLMVNPSPTSILVILTVLHCVQLLPNVVHLHRLYDLGNTVGWVSMTSFHCCCPLIWSLGADGGVDAICLNQTSLLGPWSVSRGQRDAWWDPSVTRLVWSILTRLFAFNEPIIWSSAVFTMCSLLITRLEQPRPHSRVV